MMVSAFYRAATAACVLSCAAAGAAIAQSAPLQGKLEVKWQTVIQPEPGQTVADNNNRLRILADPERIAFALAVSGPDGSVRHAAKVGMLLLTLGGDGKILHRALVASDPAGAADPRAWHEALALPGGDFLVQVTTKREQAMMELRRYSPEGTLRFTNAEALLVENQNLLLDATVLADGRTVAIGAGGDVPPSIFWLFVLGPDGQRQADARFENVTIAEEGPTRLFLTDRQRSSVFLEEPGRMAISVLGNGMVLDTSSGGQLDAWHRTFVLLKGAAIPGRPLRLATNTSMKCGTMAKDGSAILALKGDNVWPQGGLLRVFDEDLKPGAGRVFEGAETCHIMIQSEERVLAWLAPRRLVQFDKVLVEHLRARFETDALAVEALPGGDIVALHPQGNGIRVVRYGLK